jgi:predicted transposase/invertase (TIGR01784 family)
MPLNIDPKVDYAFKHLFGRETTRELLIDLLNQVLSPPPGLEIREVELLNPFNPKETAEDKLSILDIKARDQVGRQFNVEMQMLASPYLKRRVVYYLAKLHQQQIHEGEDYSVLRPTISIVFLNRVQFPDLHRYHLRFRLSEVEDQIDYSDDLEIHLFELPKFNRREVEIKSGIDIWLYFLQNAEHMDLNALPAVLSTPLYRKALKELDMLSQTDLERERYEARRKGQLDYVSGLKAARMEGEAEGEARGEAKGLIRFCEQLLRRPVTPPEHLQALTLEQLTALAAELQEQVRRLQSAP